MTKEIIINVIIEPFWAWVVLLTVVGLLAALLGLALGWLFQPRYIRVRGYSVRRKGRPVSPRRAPGTRRKKSLVQRLIEFRKKLQPVRELEAFCGWEEHTKFFRAWHHKKYRGYLMHEHGVKFARGPITVWKRMVGKKVEYAVRKGNIYYIISWK